MRTPIRFGVARAGETGAVTFTLRAGTEYVVDAECDAECDADCNVIGVRVVDDEGRLAADPDDIDGSGAIIHVTPSRSGTYAVRVAVKQCSTANCGFGVWVHSN